MCEPVLYYFPFQGRGEIIRYVLAAGNISYKEVNDVSNYKEDSPFGQLPYVEIEGKRIGQSNAIAKYFAKKAGLLGKNDLEELEITSYADFIVYDCIEDSLTKFAPIYYDKNVTEEQFNDIKNVILENYATKMETLDKVVKGDFLLGDQMSLADIALAYCYSWGEVLLPDGFKAKLSSRINSIAEKVFEQKYLKEYISKRVIPVIPPRPT